jgi:hypothetical protein
MAKNSWSRKSLLTLHSCDHRRLQREVEAATMMDPGGVAVEVVVAGAEVQAETAKMLRSDYHIWRRSWMHRIGSAQTLAEDLAKSFAQFAVYGVYDRG